MLWVICYKEVIYPQLRCDPIFTFIFVLLALTM